MCCIASFCHVTIKHILVAQYFHTFWGEMKQQKCDIVAFNPINTWWGWPNYHQEYLNTVWQQIVFYTFFHCFCTAPRDNMTQRGSVCIRRRMCTWICQWMKQGWIHSYITHINASACTHSRIVRQIIATASHVKDEISSQCVSVEMPWELSLLLPLFLLYHSLIPPLLFCVCLSASCVIPSPRRYKRREACSFMHSASQLSEERGRRKWWREGGREGRQR